MSGQASAREWVEGGALHVDVSGLPAPQPLVEIMRRVLGMKKGDELVMHHNREPALLYPELAEIGWEALPLPAPEGEVRLLLRAVP